MKLKIIAVSCFFCSSVVLAHSGGTDAAGCHAGTQIYHCHNDSDDSASSESSGSSSSEANIAAVVVGLAGAFYISQQVSQNQVIKHPEKK